MFNKKDARELLNKDLYYAEKEMKSGNFENALNYLHQTMENNKK